MARFWLSKRTYIGWPLKDSWVRRSLPQVGLQRGAVVMASGAAAPAGGWAGGALATVLTWTWLANDTGTVGPLGAAATWAGLPGWAAATAGPPLLPSISSRWRWQARRWS